MTFKILYSDKLIRSRLFNTDTQIKRTESGAQRSEESIDKQIQANTLAAAV